MKAYTWSIGVALSVLLNALTGGEAPETFCYRTVKASRAGKRWATLMCRVFDTVDPGHCERARCFWEE